MINRLAMFLLAMEFYGLKEIVGAEDNPTIVNWFRDIGHGWVKDDETAWCSCFINWLAWKLDLERSGKLDARSWLQVGTAIETPELGDVLIFWRVSVTSWKGHVGLYAGEDENYYYVYGGNQGNQANIKPYPKNRFLGARRLHPIDVAA